jgi:Leucine Rich repeat
MNQDNDSRNDVAMVKSTAATEKKWRRAALDPILRNDVTLTKTPFVDDHVLTTAEVIEYVDALENNTNVKILCINEQWLNVESSGYFKLALYLAKTTTLENVIIYKAADMNYENFETLSFGLTYNKSITKIHISWENMEVSKLKALLKIFESNKGLQDFTLHGAIQLTEDDKVNCNAVGKVLNDAITKDKVLKKLSLNGNSMPFSLMVWLTNGLRQNKSLEVIHFNLCNIDDNGIRALTETLVFFNKTISELSLNNTPLSNVAASLLVILLQSDDCRLTTLNMRGCKLSAESISTITNALELNTSITSVDLSSNDIFPAASVAVSRLIEYNRGLSELSLCNCSKIGDEEIALMMKSLCLNTTLEHLQLSGDDISNTAIYGIPQQLQSSRRPRNMVVDISFDTKVQITTN